MKTGNLSINIDAAKEMGEEQFRLSLRGKVTIDLNELCKEIFSNEAETTVNTDVKRKKKKYKDVQQDIQTD